MMYLMLLPSLSSLNVEVQAGLTVTLLGVLLGSVWREEVEEGVEGRGLPGFTLDGWGGG